MTLGHICLVAILAAFAWAFYAFTWTGKRSEPDRIKRINRSVTVFFLATVALTVLAVVDIIQRPT